MKLSKQIAIALAIITCLLLVSNAQPLSITIPTLYATTVTVFPSEGTGNVTAADGDIGTNGNVSYATAHSVANCVDCSSNQVITSEHSVGLVNGVPTYSVIRGVLNFDTSFLGPNAQIMAATVMLAPTAVHFDFTGSDSIRLTKHTIGVSNSYTTLDFNKVGSVAMAADVPVESLMTGQYANFALNSAGLAAINKNGSTGFGFRSVMDINSQAPLVGTDASYPDRGGSVVFFNSVEAPGASLDPKLVITFSGGASEFVASIVPSTVSGTPPLPVSFSITANQAVASVLWKLNGVEFSQALTPSLTFTQVGTYRIDAAISNGPTTVNATVFINVTACSCK